MRRLLIDTCVLLDLTILELGEDGFPNSAYGRIREELQRVRTPTKRDRLIDYVRGNRFGTIEISAGALLEMDQHAERRLIQGRRPQAKLNAIADFWLAFDRLPGRFCIKFAILPLEWKAADMNERLRFGPVDAEALHLLAQDTERWFVTFDGDLEARALELAAERVVPFADIVDA